jgi:putative spermidine/putrescine transport system ATP-binding protein
LVSKHWKTDVNFTAEQSQAQAAAGTQAGPAARGRPVELEGLRHRYGSVVAVDDVSLSIRAGEVVALLGPSGCGKTTLLRTIAGFVTQQAGRVLIDGVSIDALPPNRRNVGIVFQNYALFPHMTVAENVAYGLRARGQSRSQAAATVDRFLEVVRLSGMRDRFPRQLSGGQQQRVALARALAVEPSVLLLDEPFSALDKSLRLDMQIEVKRLQQQFGLTAILVTHDQEEAMSVADRIAVMNSGRVEQFDTPASVYDKPATRFVAGFIGTANMMAGRVAGRDADNLIIELSAGATVAVPTDRNLPSGREVVVAVRPEQLALSNQSGPGYWPVQRRLLVPLGANVVHDLLARDGTTLKLVEARIGQGADAGPELFCGLRPQARPAVFAADT